MEEQKTYGKEWEHRLTKAFLDKKVKLMSQIVFARIVNICLLFAHVVLTVTVRHEFVNPSVYAFVWLSILLYFLFYVNSGYTFVTEFRQMVFDCEDYLSENSDQTK